MAAAIGILVLTDPGTTSAPISPTPPSEEDIDPRGLSRTTKPGSRGLGLTGSTFCRTWESRRKAAPASLRRWVHAELEPPPQSAAETDYLVSIMTRGCSLAPMAIGGDVQTSMRRAQNRLSEKVERCVLRSRGAAHRSASTCELRVIERAFHGR